MPRLNNASLVYLSACISCNFVPIVTIMGDSNGPGSQRVPSWQLAFPAVNNVDPSRTQNPQSSEDAKPDPRVSLIKKASTFLDDEEVQEASRDRKVYFLQTRGLTEREIEDLLAEKEHVKTANSEQQVSTTPNDTTPSAQPSNADIMDDYIDSDPEPSDKHEGPPIITYPEFLLHSQRPPPLITTDRLLTAFYLTSGAAATMYGLSNYLIEPMVDSLTSARHSFFQNASTNTSLLNEKLASTVSRIPDAAHGYDGLEESDVDDDTSSDPSRFFSRTVATQTSPHLSQSSSSLSLPEQTSPSAATTHASHLTKIHDLLSDMKDADSSVSDPLRDNVTALREYLDNLPSWGRTRSTGGLAATKTNDGVAKVKAEIKSVKGTLLSARNFPASISSR